MAKLLYEALGTGILLDLPEAIPTLHLQAHVPGITPVTPGTSTTIEVVVKHVHGAVLVVWQSGITTIVSGPWTPTLREDLPHLLYAILRQHWLANSKYPVHSVCIGNILLLGHSGSGKTTLAKRALAEGWPVSSFDKTVAYFEKEQLRVLGGTSVLSMRASLAERDSENLAISDRTISPAICSYPPNEVRQLCLIRLDGQPLRVENLSAESALHQLVPFFMDTTKSLVTLGAGQAVFEGTTPHATPERLVRDLRAWLAASPPVQVVTGGRETVLGHISAQLGKESA